MRIFCVGMVLCGVMHAGWCQSYGSCEEIRTVTPRDGNYTISVTSDGGTFAYEVFCYMMGPNVVEEDAPFTYVSVYTETTGSNQAQWVYGNDLVSTVFSKVRFDPGTLRIITGDCKSHDSVCGGIRCRQGYISTQDIVCVLQ